MLPKPPVAQPPGVVIHRNAVLQKDTLGKTVPLVEGQGLAGFGVIGDFNEDMALIVGKIIVAVDDAYGVVQLEPVAETQAAAGIEVQHPVLAPSSPGCRWGFFWSLREPRSPGRG